MVDLTNSEAKIYEMVRLKFLLEGNLNEKEIEFLINEVDRLQQVEREYASCLMPRMARIINIVKKH